MGVLGMVGIAESLLWLCIGVILVAVVLAFLLSIIKRFAPAVLATPNVEYAIWAIFGILVLIDLISILAGGGSALHPFGWRY